LCQQALDGLVANLSLQGQNGRRGDLGLAGHGSLQGQPGPLVVLL
jgi:hypothetical protein